MKTNKDIIEYGGDMVTIDEILKDDPKALEELKELRKWMDENPELFVFPEEKKTQGQKKMKQLLEDARRDHNFAKRLEKMASGKPKHSHQDLETLYFLYWQYENALRSFQHTFILKDENYLEKKALCGQYGIDPLLFDRLLLAQKEDRLEGWDFSEESSGDMCDLEISSESNEITDIHNFHLTRVDQIDAHVYPIKINIHEFASKRDVLDFIEKRWDHISPHLKEKRIKGRKLPREVLDFIWKNRNKKSKEISGLVSEKFPNIHLVYFEVNKILSDEQKRRGVRKTQKHE
jgi:hypothetical protein